MNDSGLTARSDDDPLRRALARTPARLAVGRTGPAYRTRTWLQLREDHAVARDAVHADLTLVIDGVDLFEVRTEARTRVEYLMRPDLGRRLDDDARDRVRRLCPAECDLQVVIGDGLSATAVTAQVPPLVDGLRCEADRRGWSFGRPFLVRHCRVGILNDVGELLNPQVVILMIGERPGLITAESLSAYMAYRPNGRHTDADRNLISNIHSAGVRTDEAVSRIMGYASRMLVEKKSGISIKEELSTPSPFSLR